MFRRHVYHQLSAYYDGELPPEAARRVADHLQHCPRCRQAYAEVVRGAALVQQLPRLSAPSGLWSGIEARLASPSLPGDRVAGLYLAPALFRHRQAGALLAGLLLLGTLFGILRYRHRSEVGNVGVPEIAWKVASLTGAPQVGGGRIARAGKLRVGQWLVTDSVSRARIDVADIGQVEIDPNTRICLVETQARKHRLNLDRGTLHAHISAPPRLFFVDTPSAEAVDLGCTYTLTVNAAGDSLLHVTYGWVSLIRKGREIAVPAGGVCATRRGIGPGTPYEEDAPQALRVALNRYDFGNGSTQALNTVLTNVRQYDSLTLWYLLLRVPQADRVRVFNRLAAIVPLPSGVTRQGVLRLDPKMLDLWQVEVQNHW